MPDVIHTNSGDTNGFSLKSIDIFLAAKQLEKNLNELIRFVNESGGKIWLQDTNNKDFTMKLDRDVKLCYFYPETVERD